MGKEFPADYLEPVKAKTVILDNVHADGLSLDGHLSFLRRGDLIQHVIDTRSDHDRIQHF